MKRTHLQSTEPYELVSYLLEEAKSQRLYVTDDFLEGRISVYEEMLGIILGNSDVIQPIRDAIKEKV